MNHIFGEIFEQYARYTGSGVFMVLFFAGIVYMTVSDKKRDRAANTVLVHGSIWMAVVIFMPLLYILYTSAIEAGTYWRFFWLMPVGIGLAYVGTELIKDHLVMGFMMIGLMLILGGKFVYTSDYSFVKAENPYHLPQEVIDIDNIIEAHNQPEKKAAFPIELLIYVRQYDIDIKMPYGREQLDPSWVEEENRFFTEMLYDWYDFYSIKQLCLETGTDYFVLNTGRQFLNNPVDYGFLKIGEVGYYEIYYIPDVYENQ